MRCHRHLPPGPCQRQLERRPLVAWGQQAASPGQAEPAQPGPPASEQPGRGAARGDGRSRWHTLPHPTGTGSISGMRTCCPQRKPCQAALLHCPARSGLGAQGSQPAPENRPRPTDGRSLGQTPQRAPHEPTGSSPAESGRLAASTAWPGRGGGSAQSVGSLEDRPRRRRKKARGRELPACSGRGGTGPGPGD